MATERMGVAREAYSRALKLNPFLFTAWEEFCRLDEKKKHCENVPQFFQVFITFF